MGKVISLTVPGPPVGKARPRVTRTHTYTPKKTKVYEARVAGLLSEQCPGFVPLTGSLSMKLMIMCPVPKSASKSLKRCMLAGKIRPTKKPDIDNIIKIIGDALNGVAYEDDKQIVDVIAHKYYDLDPGVTIIIKEIQDGMVE